MITNNKALILYLLSFSWNFLSIWVIKYVGIHQKRIINIKQLKLILSINQLRQMDQLFKKTKQLVTSCDLFSTTELLRYKQNPEFKSANGGICSIAVIIFFAIIFTQTILTTFQKLSVTSQTTLFEETDPTYYSTKDTPFLFALGITGFNLNSQTLKYFNIEISQKSIANGAKNTTYYSLLPCDRSSWVSVDPTLGDPFDTIGLGNWLCLPPNITFQFTGKYTSSIFKYLKISVKDCKISAGDNRTCVNSSVIDSYIANNGPISFNYYFVNTIINADNTDYIGSYLQDRNYFQFTKTLGTSANVFISTYSIQTDESLWPWVNINEDNGGMVYQPTQRYVYTPTIVPNATQYVSLYLRKSSLSLSISRIFKKYDDTLSYIGGLFSTFMVCLFFMTKYNEYCYQIEIASKIFKYSEKTAIKSSKFNFVTLLAYCVYCIFDFLNITPNWKLMKHFDNVREEIGKQLDLKLLVRKINFLEDCLNYIFEDYELECMHLKGKMTIRQAETIRKRFSSRKQLLKLKKKFEDEPKYDSQKAQQNKEAPNFSNHQVIDQSLYPEGSLIGGKKVIPMQVFQDENQLNKPSIVQQSDQSCGSQGQQKDKKQIMMNFIESINRLKSEAKNGNTRCKKIYKNLDKVVKNFPSSLQNSEINATKANLNEPKDELIHDFTKMERQFISNIEFS